MAGGSGPNKRFGLVVLTIASPLDWRAPALVKIPPPAIGAPWGRAGTRRAPPPPLRKRDGMATARQREVAPCSCPDQHLPHVSPRQRTGSPGFSLPKGQFAWESPHRPAARLADVKGMRA